MPWRREKPFVGDDRFGRISRNDMEKLNAAHREDLKRAGLANGNAKNPGELFQVATEFANPVDRAARSRHTAQQRSVKTLDLWAALLPSRISHEVLGDYVEDINRRADAGQHRLLYARVVAAIFWTSVNATGYLLEKLGKRQGA
jgi:hypothetical protein